MKLILDLDKSIWKQVQEFLKNSSEYTDMDELANVALRNQVRLERNSANSLDDFTGLAKEMNNERNRIKASPRKYIKIENLEQLEQQPVLKDPRKAPAEDDWLWGQINRILPVKANLRMLLYIGQEKGLEDGGLKIQNYKSTLRQLAIDLRRYLEAVDKKHDHKGSERLTTGFPKNKNSSFERYMNHFNFKIDTQGEVSGALIELGLINIISNRIFLTKIGKAFLDLENPVFDRDETDTFSKRETEYYRRKILEYHRGEKKAFALISKTIKKGTRKPKKIKNAVGGKLSNNWSDTKLNTQINGALSRMVDLNFLQRQKDGRFVTYTLTKCGKKLDKGDK